MLELTKTLAIEWGPKVRLNCVAPGPIQTEAFKQTYDPAIETLCEGIPIPRFGSPEEVAYATVFLASPAASWITGEVLFVAGGQQLYGRNQALFDETFKCEKGLREAGRVKRRPPPPAPSAGRGRVHAIPTATSRRREKLANECC